MLVSVGFVHAADDPSYISLDWSSDKNGNHENYVDLDLALPKHGRFYLSTSRAYNEDENVGVETRSVLLGLGSDPLKSFSIGGEVEHWGNKDYLESDTVRFSFSFNQPAWSLMFRPQWRTITLYTDPAIPCALCPPKVEIGSNGLAIDGRYFSNGPWGLSLGYTRHNYDRDVTALARYPILELVFSPSTLDLAYGFQDYRTSFGAYYDFKKVTLTFNQTKSVSKVDGLATYVSTLGVSASLMKNLRGRISVGSQRTEDDDPLGFVGTGLTFSW